MDGQAKFFKVLSEFPRIEPFWDVEQQKLNIEALESALGTMSSGEAASAKWLAGVWLNENRFGFDIFEDMNRLTGKALTLFKEWVNAPFYP